MTIEIPKEARQQAVASIERYFQENMRGEDRQHRRVGAARLLSRRDRAAGLQPGGRRRAGAAGGARRRARHRVPRGGVRLLAQGPEGAQGQVTPPPASPATLSTMLELRPTCEHCNRRAAARSDRGARSAASSAPSAPTASSGVLLGTCPNCGGGFVPRPVRPARDLKDGNFLGKYPASTVGAPSAGGPRSACRLRRRACADLPPERR